MSVLQSRHSSRTYPNSTPPGFGSSARVLPVSPTHEAPDAEANVGLIQEDLAPDSSGLEVPKCPAVGFATFRCGETKICLFPPNKQLLLVAFSR